MADASAKRLCFDYRTGQNNQIEQGTIQCELLTFERGSWGALPIYNVSSETYNGRQIISGYVESQTDQKFRAVLTYVHPKSRRTSRWHVDHALLCSMYIDGRKKPVCEHTITQGAHENPVDLTGCASAYGLPFANVPSEKDTNFSWRLRSENGEQIECRPPGTEYIDKQSSISFRLRKCEIHKVVRDRSGKAAFPPTDPSLTPGKRDKDFEPTESHHRRLSHYIHIADNDSSSSTVDELVPDFDVVSGPFVEFRFYYKVENCSSPWRSPEPSDHGAEQVYQAARA
ncbi:hypothetical protein P389DRAFT_40959 [Cystobasidium minutum MCA 4210]|uniref:uncharacterized protein n=1 Tax=Cystobasidium minutum MCA 4210 TaxID=1397322 RepID=UPI0034CEFF82|eukprot:jgi/Rhomi1/40959/CE40958_204